MSTQKETTAKKPKMVTVKLFKDNERYKSDVFVGINGKSYQIKRGVEVEVPESVAKILEQSHAQDMATANMIDGLTAEYQAEAKKAGL